MSNELTGRQVADAFAAIDNATSVAQDKGEQLRGYIDWLEEQLVDRTERINQLEGELSEANDRIEQLESEA